MPILNRNQLKSDHRGNDRGWRMRKLKITTEEPIPTIPARCERDPALRPPRAWTCELLDGLAKVAATLTARDRRELFRIAKKFAGPYRLEDEEIRWMMQRYKE